MGALHLVIKRKVLISMLFIGLCLLGTISYNRLQLETMPWVELPFLVISVSSQREVNPQYMEREAIIPLESAAGLVQGINKLVTSLNQRNGTIYAYFNQGVNLNLAYIDLQERVEALSSTIPEEFRVSVRKVDNQRLQDSFMRLQVRGSGGLERVRAVTDEEIQNELQSIDGVGSANITGGQSRSVQIDITPEAAESYNITPGKIRNLIGNNNRRKTFLGRAYENDQVWFVNLLADYDNVAQLENIVVDPEGPVLLGDVAGITFGLKEQTTVSRVNGKDAVTIHLSHESKANLIDLSRAVRTRIDSLNTKLAPLDVQITIQSDKGEDMQENFDLFLQLALTGAILAVLILWFFMRNLRLVTVVVLAIPVSILTAFNFFYGYGISLNSLTLAGMALAVGMLLDNSVVVLENIYRHVSLGHGRDRSVIEGTREVWRSILAATLTTVTVFLPFVFAENYYVQLIGRNVGVSIITTLIVSMVAALLLIPMLAHTLIDPRCTRSDFNRVSQKNRAVQIYTLLLKTGMRYPVPTVLGTAVVFFLSIAVCMALSIDIPREAEQQEIRVYLTMPSGATLDNTDQATAKLESRLDSIPEVEDVVATIFEDEATVTLRLKEDFELIGHRDYEALRSLVSGRIRNLGVGDASLTQPSSSSYFGGEMGRNSQDSFERMFGIGSSREQVVLKGNNFELLRKVSDDINFMLDDLESVERTSRNISGNRPEVHVLMDDRLMSYYSVPLSNVASELATFQGETSSGVQFKQGAVEYDIVIRSDESDRERSFEDLEQLRIPGSSGDEFELGSLSRIVYASGLSQITRLNQENRIEVNYSFREEIVDSKSLLEAARQEVDNLVASIQIPSGVAVEVLHEENQFEDFYFLIGAAFILIFMILAATFESLVSPLIILFSIPLATIGAFWALILTGNSLFNANSLIGFLILLGVVVNNGIILIDYTNILRARGFRRSRALMTAGQARLRPILITAVTTIVAMIPLAMGMAEYVAPFAVTVMGGLALSTVFTLVFIPTVYSGLEGLLAWERGLSAKLKILQAAFFVSATILIWLGVDSLLWRGAWLFLAAAAVPGFTWFILNSLRRASESIIDSTSSLNVNIRRLEKIYDTPGRFMREWKKGERMERMRGPIRTYESLRDLRSLEWRIPVLVFLVYFIFFYLQSRFWIVILSVILHILLLSAWTQIRRFLETRARRSDLSGRSRAACLLQPVFFWAVPVLCLAAFYFQGLKPPAIAFSGILWMTALAVKAASDKLHRDKINIMRLKGRLAWLRMRFYQLVRIVPLIGRRHNSFRALGGITLEIGNGMFGLLGPNGAGKTTLMRIICGVLEQNYGTVRINGIDYAEKREELQGLIGYLPQEFGTYENLTAREFLDYIAILKQIYDNAERAGRLDYVLRAVHLEELANRKIGSFSGGMKQRIGIAMTLLHLPRILVVDEPTAGLDPRERIRFRNLLVELSRERVVIFSTHIIEDISSSCNLVAVLDRGAMHYLGDPQQMTSAARGRVWQFSIEPARFQAMRGQWRVVHHMRVEDLIRVRCLASEPPYPGATEVQPTLEDAYLWLLGRGDGGGKNGGNTAGSSDIDKEESE